MTLLVRNRMNGKGDADTNKEQTDEICSDVTSKEQNDPEGQ